MLIAVALAADPRQRAQQIVAQLTFDEKLSLIAGVEPSHYAGTIPAIPRVGIPELRLQDGPQGVGDFLTRVTQFPCALGVVASFSAPLYESFGAAMAREHRLKGVTTQLAPMLNLARVPFGGRNFESVGEDPCVGEAYGHSVVRGIQGAGVLATAKHWWLNNQERLRSFYSVSCADAVAHNVYYPAFRGALRAGVATAMCAYNRVNGTYACDSSALLEQLRAAADRDGPGREYMFIMSDWFALRSAGGALEATCDAEFPFGAFYGLPLRAEIDAGVVPMAALDAAATRVLTQYVAFGLLDGRYPAGNASVPADSAAAAATAADLATAGQVLAKNSAAVLPIGGVGAGDWVVVVGPAAHSAPVFFGRGSGDVIPDGGATVTLLDGLKAALASTNATVQYSESDPAAAAGARVAIVAVGVTSSEGEDRADLRLPASDDALVQAVCAANPACIVVVYCPSAVAMPWFDAAAAVVIAWLPGQTGGTAAARILTGAANPAGRSPVTFPRRADATDSWLAGDPSRYPGSEDGLAVEYSEGELMGYPWYDTGSAPGGAAPLVAFGHGLSYTTFAYSGLAVEAATGGVNVTVVVTNSGPMGGEEVVQVYVAFPTYPAGMRRLKAFARTPPIPPGGAATVRFHLAYDREMAAWSSSERRFVAVGGVHNVSVGASSRDLRAWATTRVGGARW